MTYEEMMALTECQLEAQVCPTSVVKQSTKVLTHVMVVDEMLLFVLSHGRLFAAGGWEANEERKIGPWGVKKPMLYLKKALSQISDWNPSTKVPSLGAAFAFFSSWD